MQNTIHILTFVFVLFCEILLNWHGNLYAQNDGVQAKYIAKLDSLSHSDIDLDNRIHSIIAFLERSPSSEQGYLALLDWFIQNGQIDSAEVFFRKNSANPISAQYCFWMLGKIWIMKGDFEKACREFAKALNATSNPSLFLLKEFVENDHKKFQRYGEETFLKTFQVSEQLKNVIAAFYAYYKKEYTRALKIFDKEISADFKNNLVILERWGFCYRQNKDTLKADKTWEKGLSLAEKSQDPYYKARFLTYLAQLKSNNPQLRDRTLQLYKSAYDVAKHIRYHRRIQLLCSYLGFLYFKMDNYSESAKYFLEGIDIAERYMDSSALINMSRGLANTYYFDGWYHRSLKVTEKSEIIAREKKRTKPLLNVLLDKSNVYVSLKQLRLARNTLQEVIVTAQRNDLPYYEETANAKIGHILLLNGKMELARAAFKKYIIFLEKNKPEKDPSWWIERIGKTYEKSGDFEKAKQKYQEAYEGAAKKKATIQQAWYLLDIANILVKQDSMEKAANFFELARKNASDKTELLWEIYFGIGNSYKAAGDIDSAIKNYKKAANYFELTRQTLRSDQMKIGYFIEAHPLYQSLINCYFQRYMESRQDEELVELVNYYQLSRARALRELKPLSDNSKLSQNYLVKKDKLQSLQRQLRLKIQNYDAIDKIQDLYSQIEIERFSIIDAQLQLLENSPGKDIRQPEFSELTDTIKKLEKRNLGLLLFHISDEVSFAVVITSDDTQVVELNVTPEFLKDSVTQLMEPFYNVDDKSIDSVKFAAKTAYDLYCQLIKPIEEKISDLPERLLIVPDNALLNLPFELLLTKKTPSEYYLPGDKPVYANDFLVHRYMFTYSPTAAVLNNDHATLAKNPKMLILSNPFDLNSGSQPQKSEEQKEYEKNTLLRTGLSFASLPGAVREARRIKSIYPDARVIKYHKATTDTLLKEAPDQHIIHIATHGIVDSTFDSFSGIVLAMGSDSSDDGLLQGYEVGDLKLNCELITLSACETGRGQIVAGEGILGLPRLFLGAGARSVLMTRWKVDDSFSAKLMPEFYNQLLNFQLPASVALAESKRILLKKAIEQNSPNMYNAHPFYWGAFGLYGDPGVDRTLIPANWSALLMILAVLLSAILLIFGLRFLLKNKSFQ